MAKLSKDQKARFDALSKYLSGNPDRAAIDTFAMIRDLKPADRDAISKALPKNLLTRYRELVPDADKQFRAAGRVTTQQNNQQATPGGTTGGTAPGDKSMQGTALDYQNPAVQELIKSITDPLITQQDEMNQKIADYEKQINQSNKVGPDGTVSWTQDPTTGQWTQTTTLNKDVQGLRDAELGADTQGAQNALALLKTLTGKEYNLDSIGQVMPSEADYEQRVLAEQQRLEADIARNRDPQLQQERVALETDLNNSGIAPGSSAWNTAMRDLQQRQQNTVLNDRSYAIEQARKGATDWRNRGLENRRQGIDEYNQNMFNPVQLAGSQMSIGKGYTPLEGFGPVNTAVQGVNTLGANQSVASNLFADEQFDADFEARVEQFRQSLKQQMDIARMGDRTSRSNNANSNSTSRGNNAANIRQRQEEAAQAQQNRDDDMIANIVGGGSPRAARSRTGSSTFSGGGNF